MKTTTKIIGIAIILMMVAIVSVSALDDPKTVGYTSQYVNTAPTPATTGQFFGHIRAATNVFSNEVVVIGPNGQQTVPVNPDGTFEMTNLASGKYTVFLLDGNGGQYEQSSFTVNAGGVSHLDNEILGHAFSATDNVKVVCGDLQITKAIYGKFDGHLGNYDLVTINHVQIFVFVGPNHGDYVITGTKVTHGNYVKVLGVYIYVGHNNGNYNVVGTYVLPKGMIDVTDIVQNLVNCGSLDIVADYQNQHYNALFTDPVPGTFKTLTIEYTLNGVTGTKTVDEATDMVI